MKSNWDLLITGAMIYDGHGEPPYAGDVALCGDRIAAVGALQGHAGATLDAHGLALAPGFIDVHSHDDVAVLLEPLMDFKVMQGVTTDVIGNCGLGAAPSAVAVRMFRGFYPDREMPSWEGYGGFMDLVDEEPASLNVAVLVGHNTLRFAAMGTEQRAPDAGEMRQMRGWLQEGLEAGAVGLSSGLVYEPGRYAEAEEIVALASDAAAADALYATHMRNEAGGLLESVRETLQVGERSGVSVQISHHKVTGKANKGLVNQSLGLITAAREQGHSVTADQYPYTAGSTTLHAVIQNGALNRTGKEGALGRVAPEDILFASVPRQPHWEGKTLREVSRQLRMLPQAAARHVLRKERGAVVVCEIADENDVRTVMRHPTTMFGSDGLQATGNNPHPRLYGTFPRVLGRYVREQKVLSLADAIRRMTSLPAEKFRLRDRGTIRPGAYADLVLFDPDNIADRGTYEAPRQYPRGIEFVFVNGVRVVEQGHHSGARPGKALRRDAA